MYRNIFLLLASTTFALGCSSPKPPVERKPGSFTSLTIPVFSELWVDGKVQLATRNKNGCGEFANNILPANSDKDFTLDIEGNRDLFFHVSRADAQTECTKTGTFYATKGNAYILNLETKNQQCEISLTEKSPSGSKNIIKTYPAYTSAAALNKVCENKDKLY